MYKIEDLVVYGTNGICKVTEIGVPNLSHVDKTRSYYTLEPLYSTERIHVPVDTATFMRPAMTKGEAEALIAQIPEIQEKPSERCNLQEQMEQYRASSQSRDCTELVQFIQTLYVKSRNAVNSGKKPSTVDNSYRKRAEDLLHGELAVALGIPRDSVPEYIKECIAKKDVPSRHCS